MTSQLRDLAAQIEDLVRQHPAYSQAWQPVRTLVDHLSALARVEETNTVERRPLFLKTCKCDDWKNKDRRACLKHGEFICKLWLQEQLHPIVPVQAL